MGARKIKGPRVLSSGCLNEVLAIRNKTTRNKKEGGGGALKDHFRFKRVLRVWRHTTRFYLSWGNASNDAFPRRLSVCVGTSVGAQMRACFQGEDVLYWTECWSRVPKLARKMTLKRISKAVRTQRSYITKIWKLSRGKIIDESFTRLRVIDESLPVKKAPIFQNFQLTRAFFCL